MRKLLTVLSLLMLVSCGDEIRGGTIIGKHSKMDWSLVNSTTYYYLQVKKNNETGIIEVTKEAWQQAKQGNTWPFEVK